MGELEPKGIRLINFNKLSAEEGKILEEYFDREIAPYLSANIVSKQQPFPFLKNKISMLLLFWSRRVEDENCNHSMQQQCVPQIDRYSNSKGNLSAFRRINSAISSEIL